MEAGKESEEDGWELWSRVYESRELMREIGTGSGREPTLTEVVSSAALQRTRLTLTNLPYGIHAAELKALVEAEIGAASVLRLILGRGRKATVEFYYAEQAERARGLFQGRLLRGSRLVVASAASRFRALPSLRERGLVEDKGRDEEPGLSFNDLVTVLVAWIRENGPIRIGDQRLTALVKERASESLRQHLAAWPAGAFRASGQLCLVGPFLCLPSDRGVDIATLLCSSLHSVPSTAKLESWEPGPISELHSVQAALRYLTALLARFGPLWLWDPRLTLLLLHFPPHASAFRLSRSAFAALADDAHILLLHDTLYYTPLHRAEIIHAFGATAPPPLLKKHPLPSRPCSLYSPIRLK